MTRIIEYTLISVEGVFENPVSLEYMGFRDDSHDRDGLGLVNECEAIISECEATIRESWEAPSWCGRRPSASTAQAPR